ncbi:phosphoribosyltransferase family protein [Streptomyces turgidiscabies]|nr:MULTISPECIES: phosphoribosyltransferase family protein [Streptomyces]MDX3494465.1 phosphoribosyltransferase family protein [Streptomyces turgidiscabies]
MRNLLRDHFAWRGKEDQRADISGWWREGEILTGIGPALAALHPGGSPNVVMSPEATGYLIGPLVAVALGAGFVEMRRDLSEETTGDSVLLRSTPPDYQGRTVEWGIRKRRLGPGSRVLFVDDWVDTGATALAARRVTEDAGGQWVGAAVIVDSTSHGLRRDLNLKGLLSEKELW